MGQKRAVGEDRFQKPAAARILAQAAGQPGQLGILDLRGPLGPGRQAPGGARGVVHLRQVVE